MAAAVATYSHDHFQSLSSIKDAHERFVNVGGQDHVERLKEFFVQWDMDRRFGLAMMHRHFDMERHEKLVEYNGTSTPWPRAYGMKEPQPAMWSFDDKGLLRPTKFYYSETEDGSFTKKDLDFIAKLKAELSLRRLDNVFGLARYPGDNFDGSCEFTQGRANINLQPKDVNHLRSSHVSSLLTLYSILLTFKLSTPSGSSRNLCGSEAAFASATRFPAAIPIWGTRQHRIGTIVKCC